MKTFLRIVLKPLSFLPALLMMYLIFSFSAQDAETSSQLSYKVSRKVIEIGAEVLDADLESWEVDSLANRFHGPIRKIAHMTEYFALAVSVAFPLYVYGLRGFLLLLVAGLFCTVFACGDEYHQSLSAGRNPSKKDVLIDSIGIFAGIIFTRIIGWTGRKTIFRPLAKNRKKKTAAYQNNYYNDTYYNRSNPYDNPQAGYPNASYLNGIPPAQQMPQNIPYYNNPSNVNHTVPDVSYYNSSQIPYHENPDVAYYNNYHNKYVPKYDIQTKSYTDSSESSDMLSEDMSFRKLMHELHDQKKTVHKEKLTIKKPKLPESDVFQDSDDIY